MSFTSEEKQELLSLIIEGVETVTGPRFELLEADMAVVKADVSNLNANVAELKTDMRDVKYRLGNLEHAFENFDGRLTALENDVKEIYTMLAQKPVSSFGSRAYASLSTPKKLLELHKEVRHLASLENVTLP